MLIVIKIGGAKGNNHEPLLNEIIDLLENKNKPYKFVLVHGVSDTADKLFKEVGITPKYIISPSGFKSRFTGEKERDLYAMACMKVNITLTGYLNSKGKYAWGISGFTGKLAVGRRKDALRYVENNKIKIIRGNWSGTIKHINPKPIELILDSGGIPVVAPLATTEDGLPLNVDGDRMAAQIASAIGADVLIILSNVPGLLKDIQDPTSCIKDIDPQNIDEYEAFAKGNMKRKMLAAKEAIQQGVKKVIISDSRVEKPIEHALSGGGTHIG